MTSFSLCLITFEIVKNKGFFIPPLKNSGGFYMSHGDMNGCGTFANLSFAAMDLTFQDFGVKNHWSFAINIPCHSRLLRNRLFISSRLRNLAVQNMPISCPIYTGNGKPIQRASFGWSFLDAKILLRHPESINKCIWTVFRWKRTRFQMVH